MSRNEEYKKLNDVEIESVIMSSDQGGEVDILHKCKHISIFEDLYSNFMSGYVRVVDAHNLISHFPIIGQETIKIKYRTPGFNNQMLNLEFEVYSIEGRTKSENYKSEIFDIKFITKGYRMSKIKRLSKAYTGRISDMVASIIKDEMDIESATILKTRGEYKFVIPNMNLIDTIEWLSARSVSDQSPHNSNYLFFERQDGHVFAPISSLCSQTPSAAYEMLPPGISEDGKGNILRKFYNIQDLKFPSQFDRLKELNDSMYSSHLIVHDLLKKDYTVTSMTYINSWEDSDHCEEYPYLPIDNRYSKSPQVDMNIASRHTSMHDEYENTQDPEEWLLKRKSTIKQMDTMKIKMTIPGNSNLKVGDTIMVRIPSSEPVKRNDPDWFDVVTSGKYLITGVRHSIDLLQSTKEYTSVLEISKDSMSRRTPDQSTFNVSGE